MSRSGPSPARRAAWTTLEETQRGRRLDRALVSAAASLDTRDRAWAREASYGVERFRARLDHILDARLKNGIDSIPDDVLLHLRLGTYQLLYMDGVPAYAAISEAVEEVKRRRGKALAGLVNGVLRAVQRKGVEPGTFPDPDADPIGYLSTWGSHPRWMVERWVERWGGPATRALVEANNERSRLTVRPYDGDAGAALEAYTDAGIGARVVDFGSVCLELSDVRPEQALAAHPVVVQDPAASAVVDFVGPVDGLAVADVCAAPGGKALALAGSGATVGASDSSERRLGLVRENLERLTAQLGTAPAVSLSVADARDSGSESSDVVLVDAPCSATGTFRKSPDARWRASEERMTELTRLQSGILSAVAERVRPGGLLVYSTCSLEREENQDVVDRFLHDHPSFRLEGGPVSDDRLSDPKGNLEVLPHVMGYDGAFAARMRRKE